MPGRRAALLAAAAGIAAGASGSAFLWPTPGGAGGVTTQPPTTTTAAAVWVSRHETRLGPVVIVPEGLQMEGSRVLFTYALEPITPGAEVPEPSPSEPVSPAAPASFSMTYPGGTVTARALGPGQRAARFEVPAGFALSQIQQIAVDSYWVAVPARFPLALSPASGAWIPAGPGVRARIIQVIEQPANRLVIVELEGDPGLIGDLAIAGEGRDWQSSSSSSLGSPRWTLDFRGPALPDPVPLVLRGLAWVEVAGGGVLDLTGVPR